MVFSDSPQPNNDSAFLQFDPDALHMVTLQLEKSLEKIPKTVSPYALYRCPHALFRCPYELQVVMLAHSRE